MPTAEEIIARLDRYASSLVTCSPPECEWCLSPFHKVYRNGLCRHCHRISTAQQRLRKQIEMNPARQWNRLPLKLRHEYRVCLEMEKLAKCEGQTFQETQPFRTSLVLEKLMNEISQQLSHKRPYHQSIFGRLLMPNQRIALIYLLSQMVRDNMRRNRRMIAVRNVNMKGLVSVAP